MKLFSANEDPYAKSFSTATFLFLKISISDIQIKPYFEFIYNRSIPNDR